MRAELSVPLSASETFAHAGVPDGTYTFAVRAGSYNLSVLAVNPCGSGAETAPQSVTVP